MRYIGNSEWAEVTEDFQAPPDMENVGATDMDGTQQSVDELRRTPLGEPPTAFDVRCVYDSRPTNGYDFNISAQATNVTSGSWQVVFNVPNGYRMVPREWQIYYESPPAGPDGNSTVTLQQNSANVPNNGPIIIGPGTGAEPIKSFFVCEENTTFGVIGRNTNLISGTNNVIIKVYGNLLAVTDVALPFEVTNRKYGT